MNKKNILIVSLILLTTMVNAQIKFGIKEGINFSTQSELGMLWDNNDVKTGFTLGATFDYRFHKTISLQTEINYKREGLAYEQSESTGKSEVNRNYDYYNIPILIKGRFTDELALPDQWMVSFYAGPYYSYLRSADNEEQVSGVTTVTNYDEESNQSDYGMVLGGEVVRIFEKGELYLDIRYEMGLNDVVKNDDIKNKVIGIGLGYRF